MAAYIKIKEPEIRQDDILKVPDGDFNIDNVCIVTGAGSGIGRATAIAASVNNLMTVGLDVDAAAGKKTQALARKMGGQMIFIKTWKRPSSAASDTSPISPASSISTPSKTSRWPNTTK
jgi:hypothetical protein